MNGNYNSKYFLPRTQREDKSLIFGSNVTLVLLSQEKQNCSASIKCAFSVATYETISTK